MKRASLVLIWIWMCGCSGTPVMDEDPTTPAMKTKDGATSQSPMGDPPKKDAAIEASSDDAQPSDSGTAIPDAAMQDASMMPDAIVLDAGGCLSNGDCKNTEYCEKGSMNCLGTGVCKNTPQICPLNIVTVCGCDDATYDNDCLAHNARTSVAHQGKCL